MRPQHRINTQRVCSKRQRKAARLVSNNRAGLGLAELVISLGVSAALIISLASLLKLSLHAAAGSPAAEARQEVVEVANQIMTDILTAREIETPNPNEIELTVPNRSGGSTNETIRYRWLGLSDQRLQRSINNSPFYDLATHLDRFEWKLATKLHPVLPPPEVEGVEGLLQTSETSIGTDLTFSTSNNNWIAQRFQIVSHPETTSWTLTRVGLLIRRSSGSGGQFQIRIAPVHVTTGKPTAPILSTLNVDTQTLSTSYQWVDFDVPDVAGLKASIPYALIVAPSIDSCVPQVRVKGSLTAPIVTDSFRMTSNDAGGSWTEPDSLTCVQYRIHGRVTTQVWK